MGDFVKVFTNYSYQWLVGLFFTFIGYMVKKFYETYKESVTKESEEQKLIKFGMLAILRFRVNRLCTAIKEQGFMTIDEKIDLDDLYTAYEKLGGNSRTHELYEYTIKNYEVKSY